MLIGTYYHNLDTKGRVSMPAKLREDLGEKFIVTQGIGKCLFVYSMQEWENFAEKLKQLPVTNDTARKFTLMVFSSAAECEPDKQGRILLPQRLRDYIGVDKEAVIAGVMTRAEIWAKDNWEEYCESGGEEYDAKLAELGI